MPPKQQQPTPPFSKLPTASTSTPIPSASPPIALLWAHQLRRENNALVERILKLEKTVRDAVTGIEEERKRERREKSDGLEGLKVEIEKLEGQMSAWEEGLQRDVEGRCVDLKVEVGRGLEEMSDWREGLEERWRGLEGWRGGMRKGLEGLEEWKGKVEVERREREREVEELREEVRRLREGMGPDRETIVVQDSQATETPSDMTPEVPDSQPGNQPLAETQLRTQVESSVPPRPSIELGTPTSLPARHKQELSQDSSSIRLAQGSLSLAEYLQLGEDMRAKHPGRAQESKAKQGSSREKGKEKENNVVGGCGRKESLELGLCPPTAEKSKGNDDKVLEKKRKRKRPSIPVVPIDDEDVE
ncbi:hypothetical protein FQN54_003476 [Arachnomyces sp. PD_36]|nr:hypothetical protein FQN54_003476 [Arachnomyces sp. PD_36]